MMSRRLNSLSGECHHLSYWSLGSWWRWRWWRGSDRRHAWWTTTTRPEVMTWLTLWPLWWQHQLWLITARETARLSQYPGLEAQASDPLLPAMKKLSLRISLNSPLRWRRMMMKSWNDFLVFSTIAMSKVVFEYFVWWTGKQDGLSTVFITSGEKDAQSKKVSS